MKTLIVGAGIGGLTAAIAFGRRGVEVDVVEIRPKWTVYHVGIIVQANTVRALKMIGMADQIVAAGFPYDGVRICDALGTIVSHVHGLKLAGEEYPSDLGIARPALHRVLINEVIALGIRVRLGITFATIESSAGLLKVDFTDGSSHRYDLVIGADGIYSKVREWLFGPSLQPRFTGQGVWRYNAPRPAGMDCAEVYVGCRIKAGAIPLAKEAMYIFVNTCEPGNPAFPAEQLAALLRNRLRDFGGLIGDVRDHHVTQSSRVVYRPLESILVPRPWHRGRVTLLGDAAHATTPHLGQGAAQAVEDAVVLAEEVTSGKDVDTALEAFEARRFERCQLIAESSQLVGEWEMSAEQSVTDHAAIRRKMLDAVARPL